MTYILNTVVQIVIFTAVPFLGWYISARKETSFPSWIGLKKPTLDYRMVYTTLLVTVLFLLLGAGTLYLLKDTQTATSDFTGLGWSALPALLVYAVFQTSFTEEILFRGFLLKHIEKYTSFLTANLIQAFIFALLHGIMFFSLVAPWLAGLIVLFTGSLAFCMGYINEKLAGGSIVPSWCIHAVSNIFSGLCAAFILFH